MFSRTTYTDTLQITRRVAGSSTIDPTTRLPVKGITEPPFDIEASVQPYRKGDADIQLPEGIRSEDVYIIRTPTKLLATIEQLEQEADETTIDGLSYKCYTVLNWSRRNSTTAHYEAMFIRKDLL